ncbi:MAG: amidohydrolase family protein [Acidobacteria bacterium]|nr:amidohydrolase family protein [Acidobacteriota bacterium]
MSRGTRISSGVIATGFLFAVAACGPRVEGQTGTARVTVFEGARLITGNGDPPIENAAFIVEDSRFSRVGRRGEIEIPAGAARVDLTGKTVMPAMIDVHSHLGFLDMRDASMSKDHFTRDNLTDHLERYAYHGFAAVCSFGTDIGDLPFQMRDEVLPNAALYRTVGRGLAYPGSGPADPSRNDVPYAVTTEEEARAAVRDLAPRKPDFVKIWVDDRNGTKQKLTPPLFRAAADEARMLGLRSVAHVFDLADAKELVRAGVEGFTHMVRDQPVDEEFLRLLKARPEVWFTPNLGGMNRALPSAAARSRPRWADEPMLYETIAPAIINRRLDQLARAPVGGGANPGRVWDLQNTAALKAAGVRLVLGSDAAGDSNRWIGVTAHMELENFVAAGFTPAEAIVAATRTAAEVLRLNQLGTVASGKSADFIVLDANPLDNIANTRKIARVYLRGREVDRAALRAKWQTPPGRTSS